MQIHMCRKQTPYALTIKACQYDRHNSLIVRKNSKCKFMNDLHFFSSCVRGHGVSIGSLCAEGLQIEVKHKHFTSIAGEKD